MYWHTLSDWAIELVRSNDRPKSLSAIPMAVSPAKAEQHSVPMNSRRHSHERDCDCPHQGGDGTDQ